MHQNLRPSATLSNLVAAAVKNNDVNDTNTFSVIINRICMIAFGGMICMIRIERNFCLTMRMSLLLKAEGLLNKSLGQEIIDKGTDEKKVLKAEGLLYKSLGSSAAPTLGNDANNYLHAVSVLYKKN